jgi:hypothetical protein
MKGVYDRALAKAEIFRRYKFEGLIVGVNAPRNEKYPIDLSLSLA